MPASLDQTLDTLVQRLLAARNPAGHWEGYLSSSALSTATAAAALSLAAPKDPAAQTAVASGLQWLTANQNPDGGWGDTTLSISNISTTALCWAAYAIAAAPPQHAAAVSAAEHWLAQKAGGLDPDRLSRAIIERYGKDHTFSVPILTVLALAGKLGPLPQAWRRVPQLPFELAAFPQRWYRWLRLPVVSYALPALIAIGQVHHHQCPTRNPLTGLARQLTRERTLKVLREIQPTNGGYLEATPLTSFVTMSLAAGGSPDHPVVRDGVAFLLQSMREDGSWPIDTNLATWVTTLSVNALANLPNIAAVLPLPARKQIAEWLLAHQYRTVHPYTLSPPGPWAWSDLPGAVPDADDTAGALIAIRNLAVPHPDLFASAAAAIRWLLDLQNGDGGMPTFCRGWGKLPFDRSSPDLTAHALSAWTAWLPDLPAALREETERAIRRAVRYLAKTQQPDGAWLPLWFGNQHAPGDINPAYGTARVLIALRSAPLAANPECIPLSARALAYLRNCQNPDGGWGGAPSTPSTIEETSLAVHALALSPAADLESVLARGVEWLTTATAGGSVTGPSPIGFYFAKLWYFEQLYPLIFSLGALACARRKL